MVKVMTTDEIVEWGIRLNSQNRYKKWVSLDEIRKRLIHLFLTRKDCKKVCWTEFMTEFFSSPPCKKAMNIAVPLSRVRQEEGRAEASGLNKKCLTKRKPVLASKSAKALSYVDMVDMVDVVCPVCGGRHKHRTQRGRCPKGEGE